MQLESINQVSSQTNSGLQKAKAAVSAADSSPSFDTLLQQLLTTLTGESATTANSAVTAADKTSTTSTSDTTASTDTSSPTTDSTSTTGDTTSSGSTSTTSSTTGTGSTTDSNSFSLALLANVVSSTQINEEQLYKAIVGVELNKIKPEAATAFQTEVQKALDAQVAAGGHACDEEATVSALKAMVAAGVIDQTTAEKVNGMAFAAAQLDDNPDELWDSFGGPDDPTIAVSDVKTAFTKAQDVLAKFDDGTLSVTPRSLDTPIDGKTSVAAASSSGTGAITVPDTTASTAASGSTTSSGTTTDTTAASKLVGAQQLDGAGIGFAWQPTTGTNGNALVVLPPELSGLVDHVEVAAGSLSSGDINVEKGSFSKHDDTTNRDVYAFAKPGADYGQNNVQVIVYKTDGTTATWTLSDASVLQD